MITIELEDNGQDFLEIICDDDGIILETRPFQTSAWKGALIPIKSDMFEPGKPLPIHHPPSIEYGFLKHKILTINEQ